MKSMQSGFPKRYNPPPSLSFFEKNSDQLEVEFLNIIYSIPFVDCNSIWTIADDQVNAAIFDPREQIEGVRLIDLVRLEHFVSILRKAGIKVGHWERYG